MLLYQCLFVLLPVSWELYHHGDLRSIQCKHMNSVTMRNSAYFQTWEQVDIEVFSAENLHSIPRKRVARGREHVRDFDVWKVWECRPRIWDPSVAGFLCSWFWGMPSLFACVHWTLHVHFSWPLLTERLLAPHCCLSLFPNPQKQYLAYNKTYNRNTVVAKRDEKRLSASYQRTIRFEKTSLETIQFTNVPILSPFCLIPGRAERSHVSCRLGEDQTYSRLCCAWKLRAFWMSLMMLLIDGMFDQYITW